MKYVIAKAAGTGHEMRGLPCQDAVSGCRCADVSCIALADGAGSYEHAEIAASAVAGGICLDIAENFTEWYSLDEVLFKQKMIERCNAFVKNADSRMRAECTLLLFAADEDGHTLWCHIGDGFIFGVTDEGETQVLSMPENGEEPNQTYFLSGNSAADHLFLAREMLYDICTVLLCSDGAGSSLYDFIEERSADAVAIMADWLKEETEDDVSDAIQNNLETVFRQNTEDDVSIAMLYVGTKSPECFQNENFDKVERDSLL